MRVLGIDPGLTRCGVGVVDVEPNRTARLVDVVVLRSPAELDTPRRLARIAIDGVRSVNGIPGEWSIATNIESLLDALDAGRSATQAGVMGSAKGDTWHFREEPPRRSL